MPQPRKNKRGFVITSRVPDHILDKEFEDAFTAMNIGTVRYIKKQTVKADVEVDKKITPIQNDIRVIIMNLPLNIEVKDIPANIKVSETCVPLFFKGKVLSCRKCKQKHANTDPCAIEKTPETAHTPVSSASPAVLLKEENQNIPNSEETNGDNKEAKNTPLSRPKNKKPAFLITCKVGEITLGEQPVSDKAIKAAIVALNIGKVRYMKKQTIKCEDETKENQSKIDTGMRVIVIDLPLYIEVKDIPLEIEIDKVCIPLFFKGKVSKSNDEFEDLRQELQNMRQELKELQKEPFVVINTPDLRKEDTVVVSVSQESNDETDDKENGDESKAAVSGANAYSCIAGATKKKKKKKKKKSKQ